MSKALVLALVLVCGQVRAGVMCLEWQFPPCEQPCEQTVTQEGCPVCAGGPQAPGTLFGPPLLAPLLGAGALLGSDRDRDGWNGGVGPYLPENPGWEEPGGPGGGSDGGDNPGGGNGGDNPVVPEPSSFAIWAGIGLLLVWQTTRWRVNSGKH